MKKTKNKIAKVAAITSMCALGSLSANAFGVDIDLHANPEQGIGASVDADVGLARANVGANVGATGVDADVGADVIGVGANTAGHVGFDGVKARANTYVWNAADVGVNAGATWKDGAYVGGTAKFFEPANTAQVAIQNGQTIQMPAQQPPQGCAWVYANNGRIVGYKPLPVRERVMYAQPDTYTQPAASVVYSEAQPVSYTVERPVRVIRRVVTAPPAQTEVRRVVTRVPAETEVRRIVSTIPAETTEITFSQEQSEQTVNGSTYKRTDFRQINDPAKGYRFTDKRQLTRRVIRRTISR